MDKTDKKLFGIKAALIGIMVIVVGLSGWYVVNTKRTTDKTLANASNNSDGSATPAPSKQTTKIYTDTAKLYSIEYPSNWKLQYTDGGGEGAAPDWSKTSRPVKFVPPGAPDDNGVNVQADISGMLGQQILQSQSGAITHPLDELINGYNAKPLAATFTGDAESYTDDRYLISHNTAEVYVTFREKYHHVSPPKNWDESDKAPVYTAMLHSIKFLN